MLAGLGLDRGFLCRDRAFWLCVATGNGHCTSGKLIEIRNNACDKALGAQRHALGSHDRHALATGMRVRQRRLRAEKVFCCDRDFSVMIGLYRNEKKKDR